MAEATIKVLEVKPKVTPVVILVVGMAGTGKTTLVHRLQHYAVEQDISAYFINLDPAVLQVPYNVNIDIRDTVNYKEVMSTYRLGPNGAIMTSLNLFATKVHQLIQLLEQKQQLEWIIVDTPGQIEVFTWSASGQLITEAFSAAFPTVVLFVADTTKCVNPQTFISTMLYSSGIMLKQQLPLLLVFNKIDVTAADMIVDWMRDSDSLEDAMTNMESNKMYNYNKFIENANIEETTSKLQAEVQNVVMDDKVTTTNRATISECVNTNTSNPVLVTPYNVHEDGNEVGYASTLVRSMSLFLHEFYEDIPFAAVSAASGAGMNDLHEAVNRAKEQFLSEKTNVASKSEKVEVTNPCTHLESNSSTTEDFSPEDMQSKNVINAHVENVKNQYNNYAFTDEQRQEEQRRVVREITKLHEDVQSEENEEFEHGN